MTYSDAIKGGFRLINRKWQLIAVQAGMMLFNCVTFFVLVGIPLGIAFIMFGLDLTGLAELNDLVGMLKDPAALLSKYFGLVLTVLICLLVYIVLVTLVGLYVFSGSIGTIGRSLLEPSPGFSLRSFHNEARKLFSPLMWYSLVVGLVFLGITFVLGLLGGGVAVAVSSAKSYDSTLALFLGIFFSLVLVLIGLSVILVALAATVYGTAVLFFRREGSFRSFNEAVKFLWDKPNSFWLYVILLSGYVATSFLVMLVVYPFNLIPILGPVIAFPFQIVSYVVRGYLGLVLLAAVFIYYFDGEIKEEPAAPSPHYPADSTAGHSGMDEDISLPEDPGPETTLPGKAE